MTDVLDTVCIHTCTSSGLGNIARMPADRQQASHVAGRVPNSIPASLRDTLPENVGKHCREWPAGKTETDIKPLMQQNKKPQDLIVYADESVTNRPVKSGLHCQAKCDYHP